MSDVIRDSDVTSKGYECEHVNAAGEEDCGTPATVEFSYDDGESMCSVFACEDHSEWAETKARGWIEGMP